jgi:hypothetical protein
MKKLILLAALFALPYLSFAQADSTAFTPNTSYAPAEEYCMVTTHKGIFERTLCIDIDTGQQPGADKRLRDNNGKEIRFNSLAGALNYMGAQGWLYVNAIKEASKETPDYLLRRPIPAQAKR